jgi:hypothetical protein
MNQFIVTESGVINVNNIAYININNNRYNTYIIICEGYYYISINKEDFEKLKNHDLLLQQFIEVIPENENNLVFYMNINKIIFLNEVNNGMVDIKFDPKNEIIIHINYDKMKEKINKKNNKFVEIFEDNNNKFYICKDKILIYKSKNNNCIGIEIVTTGSYLIHGNISIDEFNILIMDRKMIKAASQKSKMKIENEN